VWPDHVLASECEFENVELRCGLCSLLGFTCGCSSIASPDVSTHSYFALFPGLTQLFNVCSLWSCSVKMSNAHCWAPHVAALALQALKALHARPSIFMVVNLVPSSWQIKLEWPVRNLHARNLHAETHMPETMLKPGTFINIPKYNHYVHMYIAEIDPQLRTTRQLVLAPNTQYC